MAASSTKSTAAEPAPATARRGLRRAIDLTLAGVFFALGIAGILLPVLPTTPFLLLTSFFLIRSWPALNERLLRARVVGPILRDWQAQRGIRPHVRIQAIAMVVCVLAATSWFARPPVAALAAMWILGGIGMIVIYRLPSARD